MCITYFRFGLKLACRRLSRNIILVFQSKYFQSFDYFLVVVAHVIFFSHLVSMVVYLSRCRSFKIENLTKTITSIFLIDSFRVCV